MLANQSLFGEQPRSLGTISAWHRFADSIPVDSWRFWDARTAWEDCGKYEDRED